MKKLFLSLIAAAIGTLGMYAQTNLVATLSHGSNIQEFYGPSALSEAYTAAENGDVITLSPGTFNSITLEKAITVRGSGMCETEDGAVEPTYLIGGSTINVPSETANFLTLENLQFNSVLNIYGDNLSAATFAKCYFAKNVYCLGCNALFMSCFFSSPLFSNAYEIIGSASVIRKNTVVTCRNSVVKGISCHGQNYANYATLELDNCVYGGNNAGPLNETTLKNCIILNISSKEFDFPESSTVIKCVAINKYPDSQIFNSHSDGGNVIADGFEAVFQTLREFDFGREERFLLTEEAAAKYLGSDGTQVGIYGGYMPYDPTPASPHVKKFSVKNTTEDGKLRVSLEVE